MNKEEAIQILKSKMDGSVDTSYEWAETVRMAIEALNNVTDTENDAVNTENDVIKRQDAIEAIRSTAAQYVPFLNGVNETLPMECEIALRSVPSAEPEEVIPHRNYKHLSDYWCECGWHLGKKGEVKYCARCGRKVNWDECRKRCYSKCT